MKKSWPYIVIGAASLTTAWGVWSARTPPLNPTASAVRDLLAVRNPAGQGTLQQLLPSPLPLARSQTPKMGPLQPVFLVPYQTRLQERRACLDSHLCTSGTSGTSGPGNPGVGSGVETDARSYSLMLGKKEAADLRELRAQVERNSLQSEEILKLARDAMQWPDGFVQAEALELLATQPPSREALEGLLSGLQASEDALLFPRALTEFNRYSDPRDRERALEFVLDSILHGGITVSAEIGRHLLAYLTSENAGRFRDLLGQLTPGTLRYRELSHTLAEFDRR